MSELAAQVARLRGRVQPAWSPQRQAEIEAGVARRRRRRVRLRVAGALCVLLSLGVLAGGALRRQEVRFADGSAAVLLERGSALHPVEERAGRVAVALTQGKARFQVVPDRRRVFRVEAGPVAVEVLGTQFVVTRHGPRSAVAVEQGRVRVRWSGGEALLEAGERGLFPPDPPASPPADPASAPAPPPAAAPVAPAPAAAPAAPAIAPVAPAIAPVAPALTPARPIEPVPGSTRRPAQRPRWQDLAQEGDYDRAFGALREAPAPRDLPQELLLASDVARLSHHPEEALAPLEQFLARHRADRRAPLAAFTMGRILLDSLGRPGPAAAAFELVQELDPDGPLHQDALAREVEAWSRAGDEVKARQRALDYAQRYPGGPRLRAVRRHGGLDWMGGYSVVEISCCATGGGGGSGACFTGTVGAAGTCRSPDALKMEAASRCASKMYRLQSFGTGPICDMAGNVSEAKYTCCP
jgi:transmembrane sensor